MAESPVSFELIDEGRGCYKLKGELTFATASDALKKTQVVFDGAPRLSFDLEGISRADSAGVALLLEWLRRAEQTRSELRYTHLPPHLRAIAQVSGIERLIAADSPEAVD
ncbi:STAS domain-containing protein [Methylocaldum sp. MU1018]